MSTTAPCSTGAYQAVGDEAVEWACRACEACVPVDGDWSEDDVRSAVHEGRSIVFLWRDGDTVAGLGVTPGPEGWILGPFHMEGHPSLLRRSSHEIMALVRSEAAERGITDLYTYITLGDPNSQKLLAWHGDCGFVPDLVRLRGSV